MPLIPDFTDLRYLNEVGWFLHREKHGYNHFTGSYSAERVIWSKMLLDEVLSYCNWEEKYLQDKFVVSIGCGCSGDLGIWPAATKIAVDPLLYVYQKLGMLLEDAKDTTRTVYLAVGAEELPLLDECADLVVCRNALDHMPDSRLGLNQIWRILKSDGLLFLSVDTGGAPTPHEPTVFSEESLSALIQERFSIVKFTTGHQAHDKWRNCSVRVLARKKPGTTVSVNKKAILQAYETLIARGNSVR